MAKICIDMFGDNLSINTRNVSVGSGNTRDIEQVSENRCLRTVYLYLLGPVRGLLTNEELISKRYSFLFIII